MTLGFPVAKFGTADQTFRVAVQVHVILFASLTGVRHCVWLGSDVEGLHVKLIDTVDGKRAWEWSATKSDHLNAEIGKLKAEGKSLREIAKELNVAPSTISRRNTHL